MIITESVEESYLDFKGYDQYFKNYKKGLRPEYHKYSSVFTFCTENLDSYLNEFDIRNKKVLTVVSSGDQLINLFLLGASEIDCFDTNRLTYYFTKLKIAAIKTLSYEEFLNYFTYCEDVIINECCKIPLDFNFNFFDHSLYEKIITVLEPNTKNFFDNLYESNNHDDIRSLKLFNHECRSYAIRNNTYLLNSKNYYKVRDILLNTKYKINFYEADVFELHKINKKYDMVILSNIYDYLPESSKKIYVDYIKDSMSSILNDESIVLVEYQYDYRQKKIAQAPVNNLAINVESISDSKYVLCEGIQDLCKHNLRMIAVPTIYSSKRVLGSEDCIYVYVKKN